MAPQIQVLLIIVIAYFSGSIPFAFIAGRLNGIDIRTQGSGNVGATNTLRTMGPKWGFPVLFLDAAKGYFPVLLAAVWFSGNESCILRSVHVQMLAGIFAMVGHMFPVWLKFKGGKGVATGLGLMLGLAPPLIAIAFVIFIVVVSIFRYVSLGSILAALSLPAFYPILYNMEKGRDLFIFIVAIAVFVVYKHKSNIKRLIDGNESRLSFSKKNNS